MAVARPGPIYQRMMKKLMEALGPTLLTIRDDTHLHASHTQSPGTPETHFDLQIVSTAFEGMSLVQRHRQVYSILEEEISQQVHALSMMTRTPTEMARKKASSSPTE